MMLINVRKMGNIVRLVVVVVVSGALKEYDRDITDDLFIQAIAPHEGVQVDDLPPHSTYYNYTYEQENHQTNDGVLDQVLTVTVCLNYDIAICYAT